MGGFALPPLMRPNRRLTMSKFRETCDEVVSQLEAMSEHISDVSQSLLLDALDGDSEAIGLEKRVQKARGQLAKTIRLLQDEAMG
jgi:DNA-binding FrmR family transcriptional regulator